MLPVKELNSFRHASQLKEARSCKPDCLFLLAPQLLPFARGSTITPQASSLQAADKVVQPSSVSPPSASLIARPKPRPVVAEAGKEAQAKPKAVVAEAGQEAQAKPKAVVAEAGRGVQAKPRAVVAEAGQKAQAPEVEVAVAEGKQRARAAKAKVAVAEVGQKAQTPDREEVMDDSSPTVSQSLALQLHLHPN